jgi:hypothetical protein
MRVLQGKGRYEAVYSSSAQHIESLRYINSYKQHIHKVPKLEIMFTNCIWGIHSIQQTSETD